MREKKMKERINIFSFAEDKNRKVEARGRIIP